MTSGVQRQASFRDALNGLWTAVSKDGGVPMKGTGSPDLVEAAKLGAVPPPLPASADLQVEAMPDVLPEARAELGDSKLDGPTAPPVRPSPAPRTIEPPASVWSGSSESVRSPDQSAQLQSHQSGGGVSSLEGGSPLSRAPPPSIPPPPPPGVPLISPGNVPQSPASAASSSNSTPQHPDAAMRAAIRHRHTWTPCPGSAFNVRSGPDYRRTGAKVPSAPMLYEVFAVDAFTTPQKLAHIGRGVQLPPASSDDLPLESGLPPFLIVNWMVPNYQRTSWFGAKLVDGPGWNLVWYCRLSAELRAAWRKGSVPPSVELFKRFMHPTQGARLRGERLKCILGLADVDEPGFNMITKQLVSRYNCKPFLSKTASSSFLVPGRYFEVDIDIHTWGNAALNGFNTVKPKMPSMLLRGGIIIQAEDDDEMPEQMLAGCYSTHLDSSRGASLDPQLEHFLRDPTSACSPLIVKRGSSRRLVPSND